MRKSKRVLMSFAFREGILVGLLVLMSFIFFLIALIIYSGVERRWWECDMLVVFVLVQHRDGHSGSGIIA